eukprot:SAG31_NODE_9312_length_1300_cov_1.116570_2_plen_74_part_00
MQSMEGGVRPQLAQTLDVPLATAYILNLEEVSAEAYARHVGMASLSYASAETCVPNLLTISIDIVNRFGINRY